MLVQVVRIAVATVLVVSVQADYWNLSNVESNITSSRVVMSIDTHNILLPSPPPLTFNLKQEVRWQVELARDLKRLFPVGPAKMPHQRIDFPFMSVTPNCHVPRCSIHTCTVTLYLFRQNTHTVKDVYTHIWTPEGNQNTSRVAWAHMLGISLHDLAITTDLMMMMI